VKDTPDWKNLDPRLGASYDMFGNGKTALKVSLGRCVPYTVTASSNPAANQAASATRTWDDFIFPVGDPRRGNYMPDCVLGPTLPDANGECGALSDRTFGQVRAGNTRFADDAQTGFNKAFHNWQASVALQHELRPGMALNVGYFRTWYGGFLVTDNVATTAADYDPFCIGLPADGRMANGGDMLCGFYDIKPALFGVTDNLRTQASNYGKRTEVYNGIDVTLTTRFAQRGQFSGGLSVGRTVTDVCEIAAKLPEVLLGTDSLSAGTANSWSPNGFCHVSRPWSAGTQIKFLVVYPLFWNLQTSATALSVPNAYSFACRAIAQPLIAIAGKPSNAVHPAFNPVFEELNRRNAVVYTHPNTALCCGSLLPDIGDRAIHWGDHTTFAIAKIIFHGAQARYPNVRMIFSHGGGTMPFLVERLANMASSPQLASTCPRGFVYAAAKYYYDTAHVANPAAMAALSRVVPVSSIVFGTDFPFRTSADHVKGLQDCGVFNPKDLAAIDRENAVNFLPRFRT
jgi:predicted TIM-barrel fold metal-dependent hydrolase